MNAEGARSAWWRMCSMGEQRFLNGNHAVAHAVMLAKPEVVAAYPITPQTTIIEKLAELIADGQLDADFIKVESEHSALAACYRRCLRGVPGLHRHQLSGARLHVRDAALRQQQPVSGGDGGGQPGACRSLVHLGRPTGFHFREGPRVDSALCRERPGNL